MSTTDVAEIREALDAIQESMLDFGKRQELQTQLLIGNPMDKDDNGILGRIKKVEVRQDETEEKVDQLEMGRNKYIWTLAGFMAAGSVFAILLNAVINHFIK